MSFAVVNASTQPFIRTTKCALMVTSVNLDLALLCMMYQPNLQVQLNLALYFYLRIFSFRDVWPSKDKPIYRVALFSFPQNCEVLNNSNSSYKALPLFLCHDVQSIYV